MNLEITFNEIIKNKEETNKLNLINLIKKYV